MSVRFLTVTRRVILVAFAMSLSIASAIALTDEEVFRDLRFNLINPGARSLALGGAFVSLADDATAAQANPAGLSILKAPEYFIELRAIDNAAQSAVISETLPLDVNTLVASGNDINDVVGLSFASAVTTYERWAMGLSRQEYLRIDNSTLNVFDFTFPDSPGIVRADSTGSIDLDVTNFNVSVGVEIDDQWRVGATLTFSQLDVRSVVENRIVDTAGTLPGGQIFLEPAFDLGTRIDDSDDEVVYSLGLLYTRDRWHAGAVYRRGPSFSVTQEITTGADVFHTTPRFPSGRFANRLSFPDVFGVGVNGFFLKDGNLTLALNVERLFYANLLDGYVSGVSVLTSEGARFDVDDTTDYRVGIEYVAFNRGTWLPRLALRGGAFSESDTSFEAESTGSRGYPTPEIFRGRSTQYHGTLGVGIILENKPFTIDLAADFSESDNEYVISVIYKGKK